MTKESTSTTLLERKEVKSSNITSIGYDPKGKRLEVEFWNGKLYRYHPVTEEAYKQMMNAESIGSWFYKNIRNNENINTSQLHELEK